MFYRNRVHFVHHVKKGFFCLLLLVLMGTMTGCSTQPKEENQTFMQSCLLTESIEMCDCLYQGILLQIGENEFTKYYEKDKALPLTAQDEHIQLGLLSVGEGCRLLLQ